MFVHRARFNIGRINFRGNNGIDFSSKINIMLCYTAIIEEEMMAKYSTGISKVFAMFREAVSQVHEEMGLRKMLEALNYGGPEGLAQGIKTLLVLMSASGKAATEREWQDIREASVQEFTEVSVDPTGEFWASEVFVKRTLKNLVPVAINSIGTIFKINFLQTAAIEQNIPAAKLTGYEVLQSIPNKLLLKFFPRDPEIMLAWIWQMLVRQAEGTQGPLKTDGSKNAFLVRNQAEELFLVHVSWSSGWGILANPVTDLTPILDKGDRIFCLKGYVKA